MQKLTSENVRNIFLDCLFTDDEIKSINLKSEELPPDAVLVSGVTVKVGFKKARVDKHQEDIKELLTQLSDDFFQDKGGGMSFLKLPFLKDGEQWGEHTSAQELLLLGLASKFMRCAPREMWNLFPGGVPYIVIDLKGFQDLTAEK